MKPNSAQGEGREWEGDEKTKDEKGRIAEQGKGSLVDRPETADAGLPRPARGIRHTGAPLLLNPGVDMRRGEYLKGVPLLLSSAGTQHAKRHCSRAVAH